MFCMLLKTVIALLSNCMLMLLIINKYIYIYTHTNLEDKVALMSMNKAQNFRKFT